MAWYLLQDQRVLAVKNEQGTAIIAALLILLLLTFVAISATDTAINEKAMVRSEAVFEQNFYKAESAAMEGVQKMTNATLPQNLLAALSSNNNLLYSADSTEPESDLANLDANGDGVIDSKDALIKPFDTSDIDPATYRIVIQMPIAPGSSQSLTQANSRLYNYASYGLSLANKGRSIVKIGLKKRF